MPTTGALPAQASFADSTADKDRRMNRFLLPAILLSSFIYGCAFPPHRELKAARAAFAEAHAGGAAELASARYRTAREALDTGEALMANCAYRQARKTLPYAEDLALQAAEAARVERKRRDDEERRIQGKLLGLKERLREENQTQLIPSPTAPKPSRPELSKTKIKSTTKKKASTENEGTGKSPSTPALPSSYTVIASETLWIIAAKKEIYQDPLLWPLLYRANRDQIKDPRQVDAGQTLNIPRNQSPSELAETRNLAQKSDIFPLAPPMKNSFAPP